MPESDQTEIPNESTEPTDQVPPDKSDGLPASSKPLSSPSVEVKGFDWLAIGVVLLIAALFAIAARLSPQPANSLAPAAVLSATGCGLLVTAMRKLRTARRPGLVEAGLGGLFLALFQFIAAITYPDVFYTLSIYPSERLGFLTTWGLIAGFSIIFSMGGAALGHLAFAPLRPSPDKPKKLQRPFIAGETQEEENEDADVQIEEEDVLTTPITATVPQSRSFVSYLATVLMLGLAPTVVGYVFSAAYDYMLSVYQFFPGPYPTLRLLSAMLPWQLPILINLSGGNASEIIFLLWRIPLFLGNPTVFDLQALEPFVFNGAALGLLLLTIDARAPGQSPLLSWRTYLILEAALGLVLVLPANIWILGGLRGLLQFPNFVFPIRTLYILDQRLFALNLITGPLVCMGIGFFLRRQKRKQTRTL